LLERIVLEAKALCNADAGTLYLRTEDDCLQFVIMRNDSLDIDLGGDPGEEVPYPPLPLYDESTGEPNDRSVAVRAALTRNSINIADAYQAEDLDFSGAKAFDKQTGYRSQSFLTIPLEDETGELIGVLQLINAQDLNTGEVIPFNVNLQRVVESLSTLAAITLAAYLREQRLRQEIQALRIEIDEERRSRKVAEITESDYFQRLRSRARELRDRSSE
jgi:GAF domain-containing protein